VSRVRDFFVPSGRSLTTLPVELAREVNMLWAVLCFAWQGTEVRAQEFVRVGRVRDACTAQGLEGVAVELWTENELGPPELVARTQTDVRGHYTLSDPEGKGAKLRLLHPRYRSHVDTSSDEEFELSPRGEPSVLFVRDLEGTPLPGARLLVTRTCRHAIPTVEAVSDASGRMAIPDMPSCWDGGELALLAAGHGALGNQSVEQLESFGTVYLPRRRAVQVRVLDADGMPLRTGACRYEAEDGGYPLTFDSEGCTTIDALFGDRNGGLHGPRIGLGLPPAGSEWLLHAGARADDVPTARLRVWLDVPIEEEPSIPLRAYDEKGHVYKQLTRGQDVSAGRVVVVLGKRFSGVHERLLPLVLAAGEERSLEPVIEREPELGLQLPAGSWLVSVQVGDDSITSWVDGSKEWKTGVPPGEPVVVLAQGSDVRRARLSPWTGVTTLDLRTSEFVLVPAPKDTRPFEAGFRVRSADGRALDAVATVATLGPEPADLDPAPDLVRVAIPAGARFEVRLAAEGHVALWRTGVAVPGGTSFEDVTLPVASE